MTPYQKLHPKVVCFWCRCPSSRKKFFPFGHAVRGYDYHQSWTYPIELETCEKCNGPADKPESIISTYARCLIRSVVIPDRKPIIHEFL